MYAPLDVACLKANGTTDHEPLFPIQRSCISSQLYEFEDEIPNRPELAHDTDTRATKTPASSVVCPSPTVRFDEHPLCPVML